MSEAKNGMTSPVDTVVIAPEVLDLVRFLAETWTDIDKFVYEHCDGDSLMKYPVIQGTGNQIRLKRIGEQEYKKANLKKAIDWLLAQ